MEDHCENERTFPTTGNPLKARSDVPVEPTPESAGATEGVASNEEEAGKSSLPEKKRKKGKTGKKKKAKEKTRKDSVLGTSRGIETMFRTSYRTHMDLSSLADTKANIMISINGIIISIIIASISPKIDANPWLLIPTIVLLLSCLVSIVYAVLSARPRVNSKLISLDDVRQRRANILFFGQFVTLPQQEYELGMTELLQNTDELYHSMIRDIYSLGNVLKKKFELLRMAYTVFMFGLVLGILLFLIVFIWVVASREPTETAALDLIIHYAGLAIA